MKLNPDCTRAVLLAVESVCDTWHFFDSRVDLDKVPGNFSPAEIAYHARQCNLAGMLYKYQQDSPDAWVASDLTPAGHEFLANIREDTIWSHVKAVSAKVGSESLRALAQIASSVVAEVIKSQLGLR